MEDSSENRHCKKCTRPDDADNMVGCDACDAWEHYGCAGVSDSIAGSNRSWTCEACKLKAQAAAGSSSTASAYTSASSKRSRQAQLRLELLEQQNRVRMKKLEEEERYLKEKFELLMQLEEEDDLISNRSEVDSRSKRDRLEKWLEQENIAVSDVGNEVGLGAGEAVESSNIIKSVPGGLPMAIPAFETQSVLRKLDKQVSIGRESLTESSSPIKNTTTVKSRINHENQALTSNANGTSPANVTQQFKSISSNAPVKHSAAPLPISDKLDAADLQRNESQLPPFTTFPKPHPAMSSIEHTSPDNYHVNPGAYGPTPSQLAARQVMPRDLPTFSGDPEEWPIFYSSFLNSTQVCGYSDAENLARLQRCLRGNALESVRSRLLLPSSVDSVMGTLRMLYGRPEILINSLLRRVRTTPGPKAENLKTIVDYGLQVQNLIDHMIVSQQHKHLENPLLLNELVEKLPTSFKLQWSGFKQAHTDVNLVTFNSFISNLVCLASDLLVNSDAYQNHPKGNRPDKQREKLFVHAQDPPHGSDDQEKYSETAPQERMDKGCSYCDATTHYIFDCQPFKAMTVEARWKVIHLKNLCRTCLVTHRRWPCRSKRECGIQGCRARHNQLLHAPQLEQNPIASNDVQIHQNHHQSHTFSLFRYVPVKLFGNGKTVNIFAFLDEGSSSTLLDAEVAGHLGMDGPSSSLWLSWTGNVSREEKESKCISLTIAGENLQQKYTIDNVLTVGELNLPKQSFNYEILSVQYPHLIGLPLQSYSDVAPRMIIGLEHVRLLTSLKTREGRNEGPIAVKTRLGWSVFGKQSEYSHPREQNITSINARLTW
ncbi:uncharacterized protein LOC134220646 [Armigeres subalbatus]|uniref:uncharacterized protein LOC134220646 n=1 Tax=Armigeres subalbatus TaxID=124917 RepID=UPI002ED5AD8B